MVLLKETCYQLNIEKSTYCAGCTLSVAFFLNFNANIEKISGIKTTLWGDTESFFLLLLLYSCQMHLIWPVHHGHMCALSWCVPSSCVNAKAGYPWFIHREVVECLTAHFWGYEARLAGTLWRTIAEVKPDQQNSVALCWYFDVWKECFFITHYLLPLLCRSVSLNRLCLSILSLAESHENTRRISLLPR